MGTRIRQSELSIASAVFYFAGGLIALLSVTVFRIEHNPLSLANFVISGLAFIAAAVSLLLGHRLRTLYSLLLLCCNATLVLCFTLFSVNELRFINSGLLFYTFLIYMVWFGPIWVARLFGYAWLAVYWAIAVVRFGEPMLPLLVTLTITSALLGELVGMFRRRLESFSLTDELCGVWNKRGFHLLLERATRSTSRVSSPLSVLFLDLDEFKQINDTRGHVEGDRVLRSFAEQVEAASRPKDVLARVGGDEFVLMLPDCDAEEAESIALRLQRTVDAAVWSYGAAEWRSGETAEEFVSRADAQMFEEKARRKASRDVG